ncbi:MAG: Ferredoxin [Candidatus Woesearchaeota archaeon]|nr:Ferredoxin [Candidatus Woesearchaeota archaeon]
MAKFKMNITIEECIGCAACQAVCPDCFEMKDINGEMKAKATKQEFDELGCAMDAAESCPVNCIHIFEDGEKKI